MSAVTRQRTCLVQGRTISYREAGDVSAPAILLLHGLPGSSAEYHALIRAWADKLHLIAPDYIRFGASEAPEPDVFSYTFENLTDYVAGLIEAIGIERCVLQRPPFLPGRPRRSPTGEVSCPTTTRGRLSPRALSLSTEWEAASRTQPLPARSGKAHNILVKTGRPTPQDPGDRVMTVRFNTVDVDGLKVFYRSAGDPSAPVVLLLHGFPSASHMFRDLIPELAGKYHVVAPDLPGFGMTEQPARDVFAYTFDNMTNVVSRFTEVLGLKQFAIYVFDYGAPVGFRLALAHPDRISAIVSQNGNTYLEGVSEAFAPVQAYWNEPTQANRDALRGFLAPQTTLFQYTHGVSDPALVSPDGRNLDDFYLARPGNDEIQLELLGDYKTNVALYGDIQAYLRDKRPPVLAIWGKNDPFFIPPGAEAFRRDVPDAEVRFVDSGHFALETHAREIGAAMRDFLAKHLR